MSLGGLWPKKTSSAGPLAAAPSEPADDPTWGLEDLPDGRVRVRLRFPVTVGPAALGNLPAGTRIDELVLRRPRGGDLKVLPSEGSATPHDSLPFVARLIENQPADLIDLVDLVDINRISEVVQRFLQLGQRTGG